MNAELARQHAHYTAVKKRLATIPPVKTLEPRRWLGRELFEQHDAHVFDHRCIAYERQTAAVVVSTARRLLNEVASKHKLPIPVVSGKSRNRLIVQARQELAWRIRQETSWGLARIAKFCGWDDHTTVLHAIRRHEARLNEGSENVANTGDSDSGA